MKNIIHQQLYTNWNNLKVNHLQTSDYLDISDKSTIETSDINFGSRELETADIGKKELTYCRIGPKIIHLNDRFQFSVTLLEPK